MARHKLTPGFILKAKAKSGKDRTIYWDDSLPGFGLMVTANGHRSWVCQYRANGVDRRLTLQGKLSLPQARTAARIHFGEIAKGGDPVSERRKTAGATESTLEAVAENYIKRNPDGIRTMPERARALRRQVFPRLGGRQIDSLTRSDMAALLDRIEDESGAGAADHVRAYLSRLFTWHAGRSDTFISPIVRGTSKSSPKKRRRARILADAELKAIWLTAAEHETLFDYLVQFWLLTMTRRNEAARLDRTEFEGDDVVIPGDRHKSKQEFFLPLSGSARGVLKDVPRIGRRNSGPIFTSDGRRPFGGFSKAKAAFDERCGVEDWRIHDLRRTGRSLMSRGGVNPDHAERALGHVIPGIRGTYDLHEFKDEKRAAMEVLAREIRKVVNGKS